MHVSIIITSFNYGKYINNCIDSCLQQNPSSLDYEVIVIDDGSTDDTRNLICDRNDPLLRVISIENSGIEIASNLGFEEAKGKYVVRVDADDKLEANFLQVMSQYMNKDDLFVYSDYSIIDDKDHLKEHIRLPEFDPHEILRRGDFLATGTIYPSNLIKSIGGYSTVKKNSGLENYELIIKIIKKGIIGIHVPQTLFQYRRHSHNLSAKRRESIIDYGRNLFTRHELGLYQTNQFHPYKLSLN